MRSCVDDGVPASRANVRKRIGEVCGSEVTKDMLSNWTVNSAEWSPIRFNKKTGELYDTENQALEFDGEITAVSSE